MSATDRVGTRPVASLGGGRWLTAFGVIWLGIWMAQLTPTQLLLPEQMRTEQGSADWTSGVVRFGLIFSAVGLVAMVAMPVFGRLSDRTRGRRRRPWLIGGMLLASVAMAMLGRQHSAIGVLLGWMVVSIGLAAASTAASAMVADQLPVHRRGLASGVVGATQAIGLILGVGIIVLLAMSVCDGYLVLAAVLAVTGVAGGSLLPDPPAAASVPRPGRAGIWRTVLRHHNFTVVLAGRLLVNAGNALGTALLLFFIIYGLGIEEPAADDRLLLSIGIYTVAVVVAAIVGGRLSDRWARRVPLTIASAVLQAVASLAMAVAPSQVMLFVAGGVLGVAYGVFCSVDLALAIDVLPDPDDTARDLGVAQVAQSAPQVLAPVFGALVVAWSGGFTALFVAGALLSIAGGLVLLRLRGVR